MTTAPQVIIVTNTNQLPKGKLRHFAGTLAAVLAEYRSRHGEPPATVYQYGESYWFFPVDKEL